MNILAESFCCCWKTSSPFCCKSGMGGPDALKFLALHWKGGRPFKDTQNMFYNWSHLPFSLQKQPIPQINRPFRHLSDDLKRSMPPPPSQQSPQIDFWDLWPPKLISCDFFISILCLSIWVLFLLQNLITKQNVVGFSLICRGRKRS